MSWLSSYAIIEVHEKVLALTDTERTALTWEGAEAFVLPDTLDIAAWQGLKDRGDLTPWQAVCRLRGIKL